MVWIQSAEICRENKGVQLDQTARMTERAIRELHDVLGIESNPGDILRDFPSRKVGAKGADCALPFTNTTSSLGSDLIR